MTHFKRIALYGFRRGSGGISHVLLNLMNGLADLGVSVDLLIHATNIPELEQVDPRIRILKLGDVGGCAKSNPWCAISGRTHRTC